MKGLGQSWNAYLSDNKRDYESHWISSIHQGRCYPGIADIKNMDGWNKERNGKFDYVFTWG